ncbi:unnamed protein product [Merluccius merluccius]
MSKKTTAIQTHREDREGSHRRTGRVSPENRRTGRGLTGEPGGSHRRTGRVAAGTTLYPRSAVTARLDGISYPASPLGTVRNRRNKRTLPFPFPPQLSRLVPHHHQLPWSLVVV